MVPIPAIQAPPPQNDPIPGLDALWMPFTGNRSFKAEPRIIVEASGHYLKDNGGRRVFDGLSGLWCTGLGHCRPEITLAAARSCTAWQIAAMGFFSLSK